MLKVRTAVLVSGGGTNLQAIIDAVGSGRIKSAEIALVASNKANAYALERAKNAGIPGFVFKDEAELLKKLKEDEIELIVLAGFV